MTLPRQGQQAVKRARDALFAKDPRCHWCSVVTLHPSTCTGAHPNMATLDHIKSRRECVSFEQYSHPRNHVLACLECNQQRDAVDIAMMEHQKKRQEFIETLKAPMRRMRVRACGQRR